MVERTFSRRSVVSTTGIAAITLIAGCTGNPDAGSGDDSSDGSESGSGDDSSGAAYLDDEPDFDGWFDDVDNYEGTLDLTGQDAATVAVGAGENGFRFDPPAIAVSPGTTVTWEWTGRGDSHNVVSDGDGPLESELSADEGMTYEHTFEESGTYRYNCAPHKTVGMKGAVYVP